MSYQTLIKILNLIIIYLNSRPSQVLTWLIKAKNNQDWARRQLSSKASKSQFDPTRHKRLSPVTGLPIDNIYKHSKISKKDLNNVEEFEENPVWEELNPLIWRNAVYEDNGKPNCMQTLFGHQVKLFKELIADAKKQQVNRHCSVIEVGMGTSELFSKILDDVDMLCGVEISQKFIDTSYEIHSNLNAHKNGKVKLIQGSANNLCDVIYSDASFTEDEKQKFWDKDNLRLTCMVMNTMGILPKEIRGEVIAEMQRCSGAGGKLVTGCWHKDELQTGYKQFQSQFPELCGPCTEADFNYETGDFVSSVTDQTSHWQSESELGDYLQEQYPGDKAKLNITFKKIGVGLFAICDIPQDFVNKI